jgi:hypothetical protein
MQPLIILKEIDAQRRVGSPWMNSIGGGGGVATFKDRAQGLRSWFTKWRQRRLGRAQRRALAGRHGDQRPGSPDAIHGESGWHHGQGYGQ